MVALYREKDDKARKRCARCKNLRRYEFFWKRADSRDGLQSYCKTCQRIDGHLRDETPEYKAKALLHQRRPEVRAKGNAYSRAYYWDHKDAIRAYRRAYRRAPRSKLMIQRRKWRWEAAHATDPDRKARCLANVAACERELARLEARDQREAS